MLVANSQSMILLLTILIFFIHWTNKQSPLFNKKTAKKTHFIYSIIVRFFFFCFSLFLLLWFDRIYLLFFIYFDCNYFFKKNKFWLSNLVSDASVFHHQWYFYDYYQFIFVSNNNIFSLFHVYLLYWLFFAWEKKKTDKFFFFVCFCTPDVDRNFTIMLDRRCCICWRLLCSIYDCGCCEKDSMFLGLKKTKKLKNPKN